MSFLFLLFPLLMITFFPTYLLGDSASVGQAILFFTFPAVTFILYLFTCKDKVEFWLPSLSWVLLLAGTVFLFTIVSKSTFLDFRVLVNHLRYFAYFFVFVVAYNIALRVPINAVSVSKCLYLLGAMVIVFICLQLILPDSTFVQLQTQKKAFDYTGFRIGGPFEWSYIYVFCITPVLLMGLHNFIRNEGRLIQTILVLLILLSILLSQSKAAYLALISSLFFYSIFSLLYFRSNRRLLVLITLFIVLIISMVIIFQEQLLHIFGFFERISSGRIDSSTRSRFEQFEVLSMTMEYAPFTGYPLKNIVIENAYAHYFYSYGMIGLLAYLLFCFSFLVDSILRVIRVIQAFGGMHLGLPIGMCALCFSVFIYALAASPTDANKSAYFFFFLYGIYIGIDDKSWVKSSKVLNG